MNKRVTSPTWGPPLPFKQALSFKKWLLSRRYLDPLKAGHLPKKDSQDRSLRCPS